MVKSGIIAVVRWRCGKSLFEICKELSMKPGEVYDILKVGGINPIKSRKGGQSIDKTGRKCCIPPDIITGKASSSNTSIEYRRKRGVIPRNWKGIFYDRHRERYVAEIRLNGKRAVIGRYKTYKEAIKSQIIALYGDKGWPKEYR